MYQNQTQRVYMVLLECEKHATCYPNAKVRCAVIARLEHSPHSQEKVVNPGASSRTGGFAHELHFLRGVGGLKASIFNIERIVAALEVTMAELVTPAQEHR